MAKTFKNLHGIKLFAFDIISILADGEKEEISKVEEEMSNGKIVNYIYEKYKEHMMLDLGPNSSYDIEAWNKHFSDLSGWIDGNESRKLGIQKKEDGLLMLLGLTIELLDDKI